nr:dihydrofolate reductase [Quercus suber]
MSMAEEMSLSQLPLTIIVAATSKNGIGKNGGLPWPMLKKEMAYFARATKRVPIPTNTGSLASDALKAAILEGTSRNVVIMGRKTWDSIPAKRRPLADRTNVVISSQPREKLVSIPDDVVVAADLPAALNALEQQIRDARAPPVGRAFVIGGTSVYQAAMALDQTRSILLTRIQRDFECDTYFPVALDEADSRWQRCNQKDLQDFVGEEVQEGEVTEGEGEDATSFEFRLGMKLKLILRATTDKPVRVTNHVKVWDLWMVDGWHDARTEIRNELRRLEGLLIVFYPRFEDAGTGSYQSIEDRHRIKLCNCLIRARVHHGLRREDDALTPETLSSIGARTSSTRSFATRDPSCVASLTMANTYGAFMQAPNTSMLAADASISYITTTTTINEPAAIIKHLAVQSKQITKKAEKVLNVIETQDALCLESETTLQFNSGGGAYLPGMDENLLDERVVTFPILHVVRFDDDGKIRQVRLYWDQGTLLKQVEAIGRTGRNWPIRDGQAQAEAMRKSINVGGKTANTSEVVTNQHKKHIGSGATRDPHASLALFERRDPNENTRAEYDGPKTAVRSSAKPPPREYGDLFVGEETAKAASSARSDSPSKGDGIVLKHGAGKNFSKNRLFDENEPAMEPSSPERKKTYGQKYEHFDFGNGEDADSRPTTRSSNNKSYQHFSFEEMNTPPKHIQKDRPSDERHWGAGVEEDAPQSPPKRPIVHAARPNTVSQFELADKSPATDAYNKSKKAATATNIDAARRDDLHFGTDYSPADGHSKQSTTTRGDLDQHWGFSTPTQDKKIYKTAGDGMGGRAGRNMFEETPPTKERKIYKTAGDGMGGRNNSSRLWGIGDESDPEVEANARSGARGRSGR